MQTLVYDGGFEGFCTMIHDSYIYKYKPTSILTQALDSLFADSIIYIQTDIQKARKVTDAMEKKFSKKIQKRIMHIFMCDHSDFSHDLYRYVLLGFSRPRELENRLIDYVKNILALERRLFSNVHKAYGFVRFMELKQGGLYAEYDNDFYLLPFLLRHFARRLPGEDFIIHDTRRGLAAVYQKGHKDIYTVDSAQLPQASKQEEKYSRLWRTFFEAVSIQSRHNPKLQQNQLPLIYRKYMTEFL